MNHYEPTHSERVVLYNPYHVAINPTLIPTCDQINPTKVGFVNGMAKAVPLCDAV